MNATKEQIETPLSNCCNAPIKIDGIGDFSDKDRVCTQYYVCTKCDSPCDIKVDSSKIEPTPERDDFESVLSLLEAFIYSSAQEDSPTIQREIEKARNELFRWHKEQIRKELQMIGACTSVNLRTRINQRLLELEK